MHVWRGMAFTCIEDYSYVLQLLELMVLRGV